MHSGFEGLTDFDVSDAIPNLVAEPVKRLLPMNGANIRPGLTHSEPLSRPPVVLSPYPIQETDQTSAQCPEMHDALCRAHLIVVAPHQFFEVGEENLDPPTLRSVPDHFFQGVF